MKSILWILLIVMFQVKAPEPERVLIIIGSAGGGLHCDKNGCIEANVYWTGKEGKVYAPYITAGWSLDWKDAKQYTSETKEDPNFDVPNGSHCCYSEYPTPIDPKTGEVSWPKKETGRGRR